MTGMELELKRLKERLKTVEAANDEMFESSCRSASGVKKLREELARQVEANEDMARQIRELRAEIEIARKENERLNVQLDEMRILKDDLFKRLGEIE